MKRLRLCHWQRLATAPKTGGKRLEVGPGLLGKGAKLPVRGILNVGERRCFECPGNVVVQAYRAVDQPNAKTAENGGAHAGRLVRGHKCANPSPHRIAQHVGPSQTEVIEQPADVSNHFVGIIVGRFVELGGLTMPPIVERDRTAPGLDKR